MTPILPVPNRVENIAVEKPDADALLAKTKQAVEERQYQKAIGFLHLLLREECDSIEALRLRASAYASLQLYAQASTIMNA